MEVTVKTIDDAAKTLESVVKKTPLQHNKRLSDQFGANIYFKREDLQDVRSYKIRGAYTLMSTLSTEEKSKGVVAASAGNHAQGVAMSASLLKIKATIFMPVITPRQKINKVKHFGKDFIEIKLVGQVYDEASAAAYAYCKAQKMVYVHPFNDPRTMSGQGTVGKEILEQLESSPDYIFCPIGGGGLISGLGTYVKEKYKDTKIIGVEPKGAPAMYESFKQKKVITLNDIDTFVDGAAVTTVGDLSYKIASLVTDKIVVSDEGKICTTMIEVYQNEGIIAEPAGALSISAIDDFAKEIKGKTVVCILSGGNNDILRYPEVMEKSLVYRGLKHYFLIEFAQKPGQLKQFLNHALGPNDDIVLFEYIKRNSREKGPALIGVELTKKEDLSTLLERMKKMQLRYTKITSDDPLYGFIL
ncbi:MAG TPA: threonine ammonia-lyase IlvA [Candidatus Limnocylindrales bacterium]|nr:threonine ammonia-lyase IlvA [Candidatus Limnocylindrales bacterium]